MKRDKRRKTRKARRKGTQLAKAEPTAPSVQEPQARIEQGDNSDEESIASLLRVWCKLRCKVLFLKLERAWLKMRLWVRERPRE